MNQPSKATEDAIVRTIAALLSTDGGTLLIGVGPERRTGLGHDYKRVKPINGDGFVNWLISALGTLPSEPEHASRFTAGREICRVDVAASQTPVLARLSKSEQVPRADGTTPPACSQGLEPRPTP